MKSSRVILTKTIESVRFVSLNHRMFLQFNRISWVIHELRGLSAAEHSEAVVYEKQKFADSFLKLL